MTRGRRIGILLICSMSLLIVGLDVTIVNVALPSIGHDFHAPVSGLQWTIDGYTLVLASLLMLSGSTADRLGRKRTFIIGLLVFTAGSLCCSLAPNLPLLVVFRMLQAVGGSMLNPVAMSIITNTFTDPRERAQAIGVWGGVVGISLALGPIIGGALVGSAGWRSIFWINVPIGLVAAYLTYRFVPESKAPHPRRLDPVGQALVIAFLAALTYGIIEAPRSGWTSAPILAAFAVAACRAAHERTVFVAKTDRQSVEFGFDGKLQIVATETIDDLSHEIRHFFFGEGIRQRQHGNLVADFAEFARRFGSDALCRRIRRAQFRIG